MPFIVGSPRSGTTLLRLMLDAHSDLAIPPETGFLPDARQLATAQSVTPDFLLQLLTGYPEEAPNWPDFGIDRSELAQRLRALQPFSLADGIREFYHLYADQHGKRRVGDKTPLYGHHLQAIEQVLPESRFIHLVRDGRDVALSLRSCPFSPGPDIADQATFWRDNVRAAQRQGAGCRHYFEIRYEDLILDTEATLRKLCQFCDLSFEPGMLNYYCRAGQRLEEHRARRDRRGNILVTADQRRLTQQRVTTPPDASRIGNWRTEMTREEQRQFAELAGDVLDESGYPLSPTGDHSRPPSRRPAA